jgi:hypothetical protein
MVFGDCDAALGEGGERAFAIEPRRSDESVDTPADYVFDKRSALGDSRRGRRL